MQHAMKSRERWAVTECTRTVPSRDLSPRELELVRCDVFQAALARFNAEHCDQHRRERH